MLKYFKLEEAKPLTAGFTQMYDYAKLSFSLNTPYDFAFEISLSDSDLTRMIENLKELRTELKKHRGLK